MPFKVQTYDIDFAGIVSNITYVRWLEDLRLQLLETYYPLDTLIRDGNVPIIQTTQIEYRRPIRMFDKVTGHIWMSEFDSPRWTARMEITVNDKTAATASQSGVFISMLTMKPSAAPESLQKRFDDAMREN